MNAANGTPTMPSHIPHNAMVLLVASPRFDAFTPLAPNTIAMTGTTHTSGRAPKGIPMMPNTKAVVPRLFFDAGLPAGAPTPGGGGGGAAISRGDTDGAEAGGAAGGGGGATRALGVGTGAVVRGGVACRPFRSS